MSQEGLIKLAGRSVLILCSEFKCSNIIHQQRWLHSLSPNVKKSAWTPEEDRLLLELYEAHSTKWSVIARHIPGRTDDACSKRYREALDPTLRRDEWSKEEDDKLLDAYSRLPGRWGQVGQELQRSGLACRNRCVNSACPFSCTQLIATFHQVETSRAETNELPSTRPSACRGFKSFKSYANIFPHASLAKLTYG